MENSSLQQWVNEFTGELYNWAYYKTSSVETAEDLVQDTFLAAAEKINNFKGDSTPKTWLFAILNHKIIDYYRKKINQTTSIDDNPTHAFFDLHGSWKKENRPAKWHVDDDEHLLDNQKFRSILEKCLDALPENWNLSVKLKYLSGKKGEEICQELGISVTNYWQIIHRAKLQ